MDRRLTLILVLVLVVVASAAWWLERPGKAPAATPTPATAPLWTIESTSVTGVRLEDTLWIRPDGTPEILAEFPLDLVLPMKSA